jgi:hypothetical protein
MNIGVEGVRRGAAAELPDALNGEIEGYVTGIGMYVAQFVEWQRFSENAASIEIDVDDVRQIGISVDAILNQLEMNPDIADEEVPKTLKALRSLIANPALSSKRSAFAVLRTIENLVAKVYQFGADFIGETAEKTVHGLSSATSKVIVATLMGLALTATLSLGGVPSKVAEIGWMKAAAEMVKKQIEETIK